MIKLLVISAAAAILVLNLLNFMIEVPKQLKRIATALEVYVGMQLVKGDEDDEQV